MAEMRPYVVTPEGVVGIPWDHCGHTVYAGYWAGLRAVALVLRGVKEALLSLGIP